MKIFILTFAIVLLSPFIIFMLGYENSTLNENREEIKIPDLQLKNISNYSDNFENYYQNNFTTRSQLFKYNVALKNKLFKSTNKAIIRGKEGFYFWFSPLFKGDILRNNLWPEEALEKFIAKKIKHDLFARKTNSHYTFAILPDNHRTYKSELPSIITSIQKNKKDLLEQFEAVWNNTQTKKLPEINTRFQEEKDKFLLCFKNDTHWNEYGAFIAYQELIKSFKESYPDLEPIASDKYSVKWVNSEDELQTSTFLNWSENNFDKFLNGKTYYLRSGLNTAIGTNKEIQDSLPIFKHHNVTNSVRIDSLTMAGEEILTALYTNEEATTDMTLMYFGDSFAYPLIKHLLSNFREIHFYRKKTNRKLIKLIKPQVVLEAGASRAYSYNKTE